MSSIRCDYCGGVAPLVSGRDLYPHRPDLAHVWAYECKPCDARVGCHPGTTKPLGRLADVKLRRAKMLAHAAFDPMWKSRRMTRREAYSWLAEQLGIDRKQCHIGRFDVETCERVVAACSGARQP